MMWSCHEPGCGMPAEPTGRPFGMNGFGADDRPIVVWMQHWACLAGHHYQVEVWTDEEDRDAEA